VHADSLRQAVSGSMLGVRGRWRLRPWVVARRVRGEAVPRTLRRPSAGQVVVPARAQLAALEAEAAARRTRRRVVGVGSQLCLVDVPRVSRARAERARPPPTPPPKTPAGQPRPPGAPLASGAPPARRRRAAGAPPGPDGRFGLRNALCSLPVQAPPCSSPALEHPSAPRR